MTAARAGRRGCMLPPVTAHAAITSQALPPPADATTSTVAATRAAAPKGAHVGYFTRRPPSEAEQERRRAWGKKYGAVMAEIKREHARGHR